MKLLSAALLGLLAVLSVSLPAMGQQEMRRGRDLAQGHRMGGMHRFLPGRNEQSRDGNLQQSFTGVAPGELQFEQRAIQEQVPGQGRERLSPEERRQLRRDINAAGREIYRHTRPE